MTRPAPWPGTDSHAREAAETAGSVRRAVRASASSAVGSAGGWPIRSGPGPGQEVVHGELARCGVVRLRPGRRELGQVRHALRVERQAGDAVGIKGEPNAGWQSTGQARGRHHDVRHRDGPGARQHRPGVTGSLCGRAGQVRPGGQALHGGEAGHELAALVADDRQPHRRPVGERPPPVRQRDPEPGGGELGEQAGQLSGVRADRGEGPLDRLARGIPSSREMTAAVPAVPVPSQATAPGRMIVPPFAIAWRGTISLSGCTGSWSGCAGVTAWPA